VRGRLIASRIIECIAQLLLMARGGCEEGAPDPRPPWFSSRVIVDTVYSLSGVGSREEQKHQLWSKVRGIARESPCKGISSVYALRITLPCHRALYPASALLLPFPALLQLQSVWRLPSSTAAV
jgi:hypothetical protein